MTGTPEHEAWRNIKRRCYNHSRKDYPHYGGRGIVMCKRWRTSFANFYADMGKRPGPGYSIDRIDNSGDYEPGNCRWATKQEQSANRRVAQTTLHGKTQTLKQWATEYGLEYLTLIRRLRAGWDLERAITKPSQKARRIACRRPCGLGAR